MSDTIIRREAATFPSRFGLRGFPGQTFYIDLKASYLREGKVMLYVYTTRGYIGFGKMAPSELRKEVTKEPSQQP